MRLTMTLFAPAAPGTKRTRAELRLHGPVPWPEEAKVESLQHLPGRLIDVDAGSFGVAGRPFRPIASLNLLAPDEIEADLLSAALKDRRDTLLQAPGSWCGGDRVWVRFAHSDDTIPDGPMLDELIGSAEARLVLRRKRMSLRVDEVLLEDFRGIERLTFTPSSAQTTVVVGANGSGKTTLLTATTALLSDLGASSLLGDDDIRNGQARARLTVKAVVDTQVETWELERLRGQGGGNARRDKRLSRLAADASRAQVGPIFVHYGVNRAVQAVPLRSDEPEVPAGTGDFRHFFKWFREREDLENETRIHDSAHRDPQLQAVRRAIPPVIPGFENLRVQRAPLRMLVTKDDTTLYVDQLSDGEKCLLAMAGDIALRLAMANPFADEPLLGSGVVLIDEVELHLHPGWQRRVVPALERTFPNCQLILTTHSPAVLGHVDHDSVFVLKANPEGIEVLRPDASKGADASRILEDVLDTPARPAEFVEKLDRLYTLLADGETAAARALYNELVITLGILDPALVKADVLLRRREAAGR